MTTPPDELPAELRQAMEECGAKPGDPWWRWSAFIAKGTRTLSRDAELDIVQRVSNSAEVALQKAAGRVVRGLDLRTNLVVALGVLTAFLLGLGTAVATRSDAGPLSAEVVNLLRWNDGLSDALRHARPAGLHQGRATAWIRIYTQPAQTPPP